jgi:hypothetical protein
MSDGRTARGAFEAIRLRHIKRPPAMGGATLRRGSDGGASYRSTAPWGAKIDHGSWELRRSEAGAKRAPREHYRRSQFDWRHLREPTMTDHG